MNDTKQTKEQLIEELTEARAREEALRENEERYRAFSDAATEGLILHKDGITIDVNRSFLDMYGYNAPSELIGKNVIELTIATPEDREKIYQNIKSGDTRPYEVMSKRADDGTTFPVEINARQVHYRGETVRVAAVMNITERKQVEAERERLHQEIIRAQKGELRESEERYRAFSEAATEGILLHKDGITVDVNQSFVDMYGYNDPSELIGKNAVELTIATPEDREKIYQNVRSGGTGPYEVMAKRADGTTFPIEVNARQTHFKGETVRVVLITDLTRRKQAEAERERLQKEAIDAQKRAIQELSTPIIPVMERIIVMPLIGGIDTLRARDVTRALLAGIREHRAQVVIVDITGVPIVDSGVAAYLNKTIQAARLKGARTIVTGMSDAVAETIVDLGIDWGGIETLSDLQTGLVVALNRLGVELVKKMQ
jgi:rsbT co-antagonist protein RsbR